MYSFRYVSFRKNSFDGLHNKVNYQISDQPQKMLENNVNTSQINNVER